MRISNLVLAEYASVDERGRYTLVGAGFERLFAATFPLVVPSMYLFLRLVATQEDVGVNKFEVRLVGKDGSAMKAEGTMSVVDDGTGDPYISVPFHIQNTVFKSEGDYGFEVFINGQLGAKRPFRVDYKSAQLT